MSPYLMSIMLALSLALSGCAGKQLSALDRRLNQATTSQELAELANEAAREAHKAQDPKDRVAFYRAAAVAAWRAGEAGTPHVLAISDAGIASCETLVDKDQAAPRDCSLIRLAAPLAVQDDLARHLVQWQAELKRLEAEHQQRCSRLTDAEQARCVATRTKLPAADRSPIQQMFDGFETQFDKVSSIRAGLTHLDVDEAFRRKTERQQVIIFCNAVRSWSLTGDVEGVSMTDFTAMSRRKQAMADRLEGDAVTSDCRDLTMTQTEP